MFALDTTLASRIIQEDMALIGKIEEYDEKDSWVEYTERLEQYFLANEITDNGKKRAVLLSVERRRTNSSGIWLIPGSPSINRFQSW